MDLRSIPLTDADLEAMKAMIRRHQVAYQPFIVRDDLEVGEGWAFATGTSDSRPPRKGVVYWPNHPESLAPLAVPEESRDAFRAANAGLRHWYEDNARLIAGLPGGASGREFLELGCNTGYLLHRLSLMGARRAMGVDAGDFREAFDWFNRVTGSSSEFRHAAWDSVHHRIAGEDLPEVDVSICVSVTCHVPDPLHMLAYLCHIAREAVFFMTPLSGKDDVSITFRHPPNYYRGDLRWPASFDSEVLPSATLVELSLEQCGFADVQRPKENVFLARRTASGRSIYDPGGARASLDPQLVEEGYRTEFNIIRLDGQYYALAQDEGAFSIRKVEMGEYRRCIAGSSIEQVKRRLDACLAQPGGAWPVGPSPSTERRREGTGCGDSF